MSADRDRDAEGDHYAGGVTPKAAVLRGGWVDADGDPLVTVVAWCRLLGGDDVTLNREHDGAAWVTPREAVGRVEYGFLADAVGRAAGAWAWTVAATGRDGTGAGGDTPAASGAAAAASGRLGAAGRETGATGGDAE